MQVLQGETFLDGVLNSVALIFISEIDDHLPRLLEIDTLDIVQGFLIDQAMEEYETQNLKEKIEPIEFSDMLLTNSPESGSVESKGITFQPYEVIGESLISSESASQGEKFAYDIGLSLRGEGRSRKRPRKKTTGRTRTIEGDDGQQIANKRSVTSDCLLRKIEWQYTKGYDDTCQPRIGHLKLTKLNDQSKTIEIKGKNREKDVTKKPFFSVTGVFIITSFTMSDDILK